MIFLYTKSTNKGLSYLFFKKCYFVAFFLLLFFTNHLFAQVSVLTQHNNLKRTGWNGQETQLTQASVSGGNFGKVFTRAVDDQIYAQPLVVSGVSIGGGTHNIVIVATVNNSLYAFDADDSATSAPYWQANLTYSGYRAPQASDYPDACAGNYQDFSGKFGIVGTPVIDNTTNTLYVVARSTDNTATTFVQYLHAINILDGTERPNSPVYITATVPGTGDGSDGTNIPFHERQQNQRPGLLLYNGVVYIAWASHCDLSPYHGWIIGYDASTLAQKYVYNDTRNGGLGGIWMSGQAPAVDDNGYIYVSTGNGTTGSTGNANDTANRASSLLKLSTSSGALKVADFFTPSDFASLNDNDLDYGVDGAIIIPNTNLSLSGSKESYLYLINNNAMGGTTTDNSNVLQQLNVNAGFLGEKHIHGSPVYFQDNNSNEYVYAWAENGLLKQFPFNRGTMLFDTLNKIVGNTQLPAGMPGAMLSASSNGLQQGSGILWASHPLSGDANHNVVPGILQAFDATNVTNELWNSNMNAQRDSIGRFAKFVVPTIANGKVYMATFSNKLIVYGLNSASTSSCPNPLPSPWQSADIGYVAYAGSVCYDTGAFTITASGDDIWNTVDAFHYVYQTAASSNFEIIARADSAQNTSPNAKVGVMVRANLDPGSPHVFMTIEHDYGSAFQMRMGQNNYSTTSGDNPNFMAPSWLKIVASGNKYIGYASTDGSTWTFIDSVVLALGAKPYVGIAYTTHNNSVLGTALVDKVSLNDLSPLPVSLTNFNARNINNTYALLKWATTTEINNDHFDIERSGSNSNFVTIGSVKSLGNSTEAQQYAFNDNNPLDGANYYRLKQVDINGNVQYSTIAVTKFNLKLIDISPNPSHGQLYIRNNSNFSNNSKLIIQVTNEDGGLLFQQESASSGNNLITVNLPLSITNGAYFVKVINANGDMQAKKIFVNR